MLPLVNELAVSQGMKTMATRLQPCIFFIDKNLNECFTKKNYYLDNKYLLFLLRSIDKRKISEKYIFKLLNSKIKKVVK